jgi:hypothetical protein
MHKIMIFPESITLTLLITVNVILMFIQLYHLYKSKRLYQKVSLSADNIKTDMQAFIRGSSNVDRHIATIDEKMRRFADRLDKLEAADSVKREYDNAIRAVKAGTSVDSLIDVHGLSQAEAKLLISLHGDE